jgi:hypothetical protein
MLRVGGCSACARRRRDRGCEREGISWSDWQGELDRSPHLRGRRARLSVTGRRSPNASLLTVTIDEDTGRIKRVVVVLPGRQDLRPAATLAGRLESYATVRLVAGLPIVDQSVFSDSNLVEEGAGFTLAQVGKTIYMILHEEVTPDRCVRCERFGFFISHDLLCGFAFFDLTDREVEVITDFVARHQTALPRLPASS